MKRLLSFVLCIAIMTLVSACGSGNYPIKMGESYQDVYDYFEKNNVGDELLAQDESISGELDWFGDGTIYGVWCDVDKTSDKGVTSFTVQAAIDDMDTEETALAKGEELMEKIKKRHGNPVGDSNPSINDVVMGETIIWKDNNFTIRFRYVDVISEFWAEFSESGSDD